MIHDEICTYEVCKLAKEKGFPLKEIESWHYEFDGRPTKEIVDNRQYPIIPQSLLQRWLREERGIDIVVMPIRPKGYSFFICGHIPEDDGACMDREYSLTYELALEDALKYALENLFDMSGVICGDNRFEIIEKAKKAVLDSTNINTSSDEMKVLDSILFRAWQMGWLNKYYEHNKNTMTLNEYQKQAMTTCTDSSDNDTYALFQLPAEVGELMDKVAKARRKEIITFVDDNIYPGKNGIQDGVHTLEYAEFKEGMFKELGDIMWSCAQIAHRFGWSLEEVCKGNLAKLADRAKRGVIVGNGDNR